MRKLMIKSSFVTQSDGIHGGRWSVRREVRRQATTSTGSQKSLVVTTVGTAGGDGERRTGWKMPGLDKKNGSRLGIILFFLFSFLEVP